MESHPSSTEKVSPLQRITDLSTMFCNSRIFPGQGSGFQEFFSNVLSQIRNPDAQRIRNNPHRPQRDVPLSPLDSSNVRPVQTRTAREFLLHPPMVDFQTGSRITSAHA